MKRLLYIWRKKDRRWLIERLMPFGSNVRKEPSTARIRRPSRLPFKLPVLVLGLLSFLTQARAEFVYPPQTVPWTVWGTATETASVVQNFSATGVAVFQGKLGYYQGWSGTFQIQGPQYVNISRSGATPNGVNIVPNCSGVGYSVADGPNWLGPGMYCLLVSGYQNPVTATIEYTNSVLAIFQDSATVSGIFNVWYDTAAAVFVSSGTTNYALTFIRPDGTVANGGLTGVVTSSSTTNTNVILSRTGSTVGTLSAVITQQVWVDPTPAAPQAAQTEPYNYPNPFKISDGTNFVFIAYSPVDRLKISVYSIYQNLLWQTTTGALNPGVHQIHWDGRDVNGRPVFSGMYVAVFVSSQGQQTTRLVGIR